VTEYLDFDMVMRLLAASFLGALIGLEREVHGRPAGFRTHLLVSLGSCLFVLTSIAFYKSYGNFSGTVPVGVDPGRVAAQVVTGIGFLGAGAIMREKGSIRGLTTAACLWVVAAIGVACGVGLYAIATIVTSISLLSLLCLKRVENLISRDTYTTLTVWSRDGESQITLIQDTLRGCGLDILGISVERDKPSLSLSIQFHVRYNKSNLSCNLVDALVQIDGVKRVRVE
jgi:putative Mg2+ transporter-C (MgtC) family protein